MSEDDEPAPESGPYCEHWSEAWDCDHVCASCGHLCSKHGPECYAVEDCKCEAFVNAEPAATR